MKLCLLTYTMINTISLKILKFLVMFKHLILPLAMFLALGAVSWAQGTVPVTGTVRDAAGAPLPGATVSVEGTSNGAVTDAAGKFSLKVPGESAILVAESLGYKSVKIKVGSRRSFDFDPASQCGVSFGIDMKNK